MTTQNRDKTPPKNDIKFSIALSEEQKLIKQQVEKFVQNDYSFDIRNKILKMDEGFDRAIWKFCLCRCKCCCCQQCNGQHFLCQ